MNLLPRLCLTVCAFGLALEAGAKSAAEVFEEVSDSVVVVYGKDREGDVIGLGSGVVLAAGEVVTNCHVIEEVGDLSVKYKDSEHAATRKHSDLDRDVCSLTVQGLKATAARLGATQPLKVGQRVYVIGAPRGLELTLSEGIISSLREVGGGRYIQITAPISAGSSGGGLFDEEGRLIGLPTFYLAEGQQLNFAVPVEWINELPNRHKKAEQAAQTPYTDWLNKALALEEKQDWAELLKHALRWTKAQPGMPMAWNILGVGYWNSGQTAEAIEAYRQAVRIGPAYTVAWFNLGVVYRDSGQVAKAIEAYRQALRFYPKYVEAWFGLGVVYGESGQTAKEVEAYRQALRIDPEYVEAWFKLGVVYGKSGQTAKAIEAYRQALRINPEFAEAWFLLGSSYKRTGKMIQAIEAYQNAVRVKPDDAVIWFRLGKTYKRAGQSTQAIDAFQQAVRIKPDYVAAWSILGDAYQEAGKMAQSLDTYHQALRINPDAATIWLRLAVAYSESGQVEEEDKAYQQALSIEPDAATLWLRLGIQYHGNGSSKDKLMVVYRRLKSLDPEMADYFFSEFISRKVSE